MLPVFDSAHHGLFPQFFNSTAQFFAKIMDGSWHVLSSNFNSRIKLLEFVMDAAPLQGCEMRGH